MTTIAPRSFRRTRILAAVGLASLATACSVAPSDEDTSELDAKEPEVASTGQALNSGVFVPTPALDAVGLLMYDTGVPICAVTLVAPQLALTTASCIGDRVRSQLRVAVGLADGFDSRSAKGHYANVRIKSVDYESQSTGTTPDFRGDVAVLHLAKPIVGVAPLGLGRLSPGNVGTPFLAVAYGGRYGAAYPGERRVGTATLRALNGSYMEHTFGSEEALGRFLGLDATSPAAEWKDVAYNFTHSPDLIEGYEALVGDAPGDARTGVGDSGGPLLRAVDGRMTVFGLVGWGASFGDEFSDPPTAVYTVFGPTTRQFLTVVFARENLASPQFVAVPQDSAAATPPGSPAPMCVTKADSAWCEGNEVHRCVPVSRDGSEAPGSIPRQVRGYRHAVVRCDLAGLVCAESRSDGEAIATCASPQGWQPPAAPKKESGAQHKGLGDRLRHAFGRR